MSLPRSDAALSLIPSSPTWRSASTAHAELMGRTCSSWPSVSSVPGNSYAAASKHPLHLPPSASQSTSASLLKSRSLPTQAQTSNMAGIGSFAGARASLLARQRHRQRSPSIDSGTGQGPGTHAHAHADVSPRAYHGPARLLASTGATGCLSRPHQTLPLPGRITPSSQPLFANTIDHTATITETRDGGPGSPLIKSMAVVLEALVNERASLNNCVDYSNDPCDLQLTPPLMLSNGSLDWQALRTHIKTIGRVIASSNYASDANPNSSLPRHYRVAQIKVYANKILKVSTEVVQLYTENYGFATGLWDDGQIKQCAREIGRWSIHTSTL
jgi:hypothetical protein